MTYVRLGESGSARHGESGLLCLVTRSAPSESAFSSHRHHISAKSSSECGCPVTGENTLIRSLSPKKHTCVAYYTFRVHKKKKQRETQNKKRLTNVTRVCIAKFTFQTKRVFFFIVFIRHLIKSIYLLR